MNIQLILLLSLSFSIIAMGIHMYMTHERLNILNDRLELLIGRVIASEDSLHGIRTVVIKSLDADITNLKKEIEDLKKCKHEKCKHDKCNHEKCLKRGSDSRGNGHTA